MKFSHFIFEKLSSELSTPLIIDQARKNISDFIRKGITVREILLFLLNKRGLTLKMEVHKFCELLKKPAITDSGMLDRRKRVKPSVIKMLNASLLADFYAGFKPGVRTYKGFLLLAHDGSDCEVPNTPLARENFGAALNGSGASPARLKLSNCTDMLNGYVLDSEIEGYKYSERELSRRHRQAVKGIISDYPSITLLDRGYGSLSMFFEMTRDNEMFLVRIKKNDYKNDRESMVSEDEWVTIGYQRDRLAPYRESAPELHAFYERGGAVRVRFVEVRLRSGEAELLATNLPTEDFSTEDISSLYEKRWGIETNYHTLKESLKMAAITSSHADLVMQEIYSTVLAYNLMHSVENDAEKEIDQKKWKYPMKINTNMAIGFTKGLLVELLTADAQNRSLLLLKLQSLMLKHLVPRRHGRTAPRRTRSLNKYPLTKRKSY